MMWNDDSKIKYLWKHHAWFVLNASTAIASAGFLLAETMHLIFPSDQGIGYDIPNIGWIVWINSLFWFQSALRCYKHVSVSNRNSHGSENTTGGYSFRGQMGGLLAGLTYLVMCQYLEYWILLAYATVVESCVAYQEWPTTQSLEERDEQPVTIANDGGGGFQATTRPTPSSPPNTDYNRMV